MLTHEQVRAAEIGNVLSMFCATGLSESERLEAAYMLQKTIVQGYLQGVNIPQLMQHRAQTEGQLHIGFNDAFIPHRNSITFDRGSWRSKPADARLGDFVNRLGTRLKSRGSDPQPPRRNAAPRYNDTPRSGPLRNQMPATQVTALAQTIARTLMPSTTSHVFKGLVDFQQSAKIAPQRMMSGSHLATNMQIPQSTIQMMDRQTQATRDLPRQQLLQGLPAMTIAMASPRTGPGSARMPQMSQQQAQNGLAATGRPARMLLFTGSGWTGEINDAAANLEAMGIAYDKVSSLAGVDYSKYGGIFFAGGNAGPEWAAIQNQAPQLRAAIQGGLNYIGNCAGAFLAGDFGGGLKLTPTTIDYPHQNPNAGSPLITMWDGQKRHLDFEGGPGFDDVLKNTPGAQELASFQNGEAGIVSFNYGQGHVILSAFHVGMSGSGYSDADGDDDAYWRAMLKATVQGTNPDGTVTQGPGPTPPNTPNIQVPSAPTVPSSGSSPARSGGSGTRSQGRTTEKTAVAGMLPDMPELHSFSASLNDILNRTSPMLQGLAGAVTRGMNQ